ncbi:MAG: hypothetical protein IPQ22_04290 [Rhodoferax sp.]|jgi:hypothetical protein|nr:hypothetical protein [Rhodoferax sp.]
MRFRLLRRRLTISAPRMAVRSALPWPFRWAVLAIVMGFCAAIGLWAFEFGKDIAGLEKGSKDQLMRLHAQVIELQTELATVKTERDQAQSVANTAGTLVTTERTTQEQVAGHVKQLEMENQSLRDDLGFFEKLIPASGVDGLAIRGLHAELQGDGTLKWQVLVIQSGKNPPEFNGRLELTFSGVLDGKPWSAALPGELPAVKVRQYGRIGGAFEVPAHVQVKGFSAKVMDGATVKATQSIKL